MVGWLEFACLDTEVSCRYAINWCREEGARMSGVKRVGYVKWKTTRFFSWSVFSVIKRVV